MGNYVKKEWTLDTFHKGDKEFLNGLNHMEQGIADAGSGTGVYKYKGTKENYTDLPTSGNEVGDVWNVVNAYEHYPAGTNFAWTGTAWDALGGSVDLSVFRKAADQDVIDNGIKDRLAAIEGDYLKAVDKTDLQNNINLKQDIISDLADIRDGAAKGKTAIQEHQDISGKANVGDSYLKAESDAKYLTEHQDISGKQDKLTSVNAGNSITIVDANLPAEYQEVEYLEATGTQYIKTEYLTNANTNIEIKFLPVSSGSGWQCLFGYKPTYMVTANTNNYSILFQRPNKLLGLTYRNVDTGEISGATVSETDKNIVYNDGKSFYLNNRLVRTFTDFTTAGTSEAYLLASHDADSVRKPATYFYIGKIYYCKITENSSVVRHMIPCYRKADNVAGMYDIITNKFYPNAATTGNDFTVGQDIVIDTKIGVSKDLTVNTITTTSTAKLNGSIEVRKLANTKNGIIGEGCLVLNRGTAITENAIGDKAVILGDGCIATDEASIAAGKGARAGGSASMAINKDTKAIGKYSFAQGIDTFVSGVNSQAFGNLTAAIGGNQTVIGKLNIPDQTNNLFIVGNGTEESKKTGRTEATELIGFYVINKEQNGYAQRYVEITADNCQSIWDNTSITTVYKLSNAFAVDKNGNTSLKLQHIELTGTSGTLTDEQFNILNDNDAAYITLSNIRYNFHHIAAGRGGVIITFSSNSGTLANYIDISLSDKRWNYYSKMLQEQVVAGTNIDITNNTISVKIDSISLSGIVADGAWHDGGTLSESDANILLASELNYIWLNNMHRLDFKYKDVNNNLATYAATDGEKSHLVEIVLYGDGAKTWRYKHITEAPNEDGTYVWKCVVSGGVKTYQWVKEN